MSRKAAKSIGALFITTIKKWYDRDPFRESTVIAYHALFSLPGLLVVIMTLAGYFFDAEIVSGQLHKEISRSLGRDTANQIQEMVTISMKNKFSGWAALIGVATIIIGATGVFIEIQKELNIIWEVKGTPLKSGIWLYLKKRIFSFGLVISIVFLLLISLVLSSLLSALGDWIIKHWSESMLIILQSVNFIFSFSVITVLFAMIFRILPDAEIKWHSVWIGAIATSFLFVIGKTALGLYLGRVNPGSGYGAAGSIILILLWISYSAMILSFGAEFTKVYSDYFYGTTPVSETAVREKGRVK
jgi:membrane protein